jgi:glutamate-1-semialdehyde aminotransferase
MPRTTEDHPQAIDPRVDLGRVAKLKQREDAAFFEARPRSLALLDRARRSMPLGVPMSWMDWLFDHAPIFVDSADGAYFTDVDGLRYLDMYMNITVSSAGHTHPAVVAAAVDRLQRGVQFGLPTEDAIAVSQTLAERWSLPKWQFALSSTQSVTDVIRLARIATGRERLLTFEGKYHGHVGETSRSRRTAGRSRSTWGSTPPTSRGPRSLTGTTSTGLSVHSGLATSRS